MKIVFPEMNSPIIQEAIQKDSTIEAVPAANLATAVKMVGNGEADTMIAGLDAPSRDVILACRDYIGVQDKTFTSSFVMKKGEQTLIIGDVATCKNPSENQLYDIICQTYETAKLVLEDIPKVALLSFSTLGSGGCDESITKIQNVLLRIKQEHPEIMIDGELQLDAAINPVVARKKAPNSPVAGKANVLICPDLNSANILYKSLEQFGGFTAAGPILQGFNVPLSDLSRGSTVDDVVEVIEILKKIIDNKKA